MSARLVAVDPPDRVYRLGRRPDAWRWPDWRHATAGTFGNRYDDPAGQYRVLYASGRRIGAFLETLARFRPDPAVLLESIAGDPRDAGFPAAPPGPVPRSWLQRRCLGSARLAGAFCDVGHSATLAHLRGALAGRLVHYGLDDLDAGDVRRRWPRRFTQDVSRLVFEAGADGERAFAGIRYASRLGDEIDNWAIFEPAKLDGAMSEPIAADDPDLLEALARFGLTLA
jgi:hypothetical protein